MVYHGEKIVKPPLSTRSRARRQRPGQWPKVPLDTPVAGLIQGPTGWSDEERRRQPSRRQKGTLLTRFGRTPACNRALAAGNPVLCWLSSLSQHRKPCLQKWYNLWQQVTREDLRGRMRNGREVDDSGEEYIPDLTGGPIPGGSRWVAHGKPELAAENTRVP